MAFTSSVVCEDSYKLPVEKVTEVGDGPDYGQCLESHDPVVLVRLIKGSAGVGEGMETLVVLVLPEYCSNAINRGFRL